MVNIIGITGQMHSGKSTVSSLILNRLKNEIEAENIKIAQPLYDIQKAVYDIVGLDVPYPKDRELLQWVGSEWGRRKDVDIWINAWGRTVARKLGDASVQLVICDDLRYDNEASKIKGAGGKIIQVMASDYVRQARGSTIGSGHQSERGISKEFIDACVTNNGSLSDLELQVNEILSFWEIL